MLPAVNPVP